MHIHPSSPNSSQSEDDAATKIQAGFRGYRVRKQLKNSHKLLYINLTKNSQTNSNNMNVISQNTVRTAGNIEEKSATKIQAGIRGFLVRKKQKNCAEAATKIQASFRGFKARKELKNNIAKDVKK